MVRCLIKTRPSVVENSVERWVAIAAPFQGAGAKILLEFLQGYNLGNIVIDAESAKVLSLESPAVYELLPQETFPWELAPYISVGACCLRARRARGAEEGYLEGWCLCV